MKQLEEKGGKKRKERRTLHYNHIHPQLSIVMIMKPFWHNEFHWIHQLLRLIWYMWIGSIQICFRPWIRIIWRSTYFIKTKFRLATTVSEPMPVPIVTSEKSRTSRTLTHSSLPVLKFRPGGGRRRRRIQIQFSKTNLIVMRLSIIQRTQIE